ncbi:MAG: hypothetical protein AAGK00_07560 [Pseudomonadota bacterium]
MARILCWAIGICLSFWSVSAMAQVQPGGYYGIDDAAGARILIEQDAEGYRGTFFDPLGASQDFEADAVDDTATAILDMDQRTVLLRIAPLPFGAEVTLIPFDPEGRLITNLGRVLTFVRDGTALPEMPTGFVEAPRAPGQTVAGNSFVASYQFWEPVGVSNGYVGLPDRFRTLMRMFPAVQLDVIWKLCLAPSADQALAIALRGQDVSCAQVIDGIAAVQQRGQFGAFKSVVEDERSSLQMSVRCADGYVESKEACDAAARRLSQAAISLRTAGMVLRQFQ